ncbi:uncharacterized protein LOC143628931 [Bidens hawaiensis]|uniref:uncharacterized protein LOC143628931 n=1 Tax=Bidens hawaiensis TaxID=980011 RepID=UPI00404A831F
MKGYRENVVGGGSYEEVFGGAPKFGARTLPPRMEDYSEIFQGFHASSIPVLDLPPAAVWFDVSLDDYSEVFGGFNALDDFACHYQDLFHNSKDNNDSDEDVWTPAQSGSLSDESDPHMNQQAESSGTNLKHEPHFQAGKDSLDGMPNVSDAKGSDNQAPPTKTQSDNYFSLVNNNNHLCASMGFGEISQGKKLKKSLSQPLVSVSGLSLTTQPSNLPPPSRPPPALTSKKGDPTSKLKTSKSYAFDQSPPFFDVEIDASSSAAAAMKDAVEQAQAKLKSAKALINRKKKKNVKENEIYENLTTFEGVRGNRSLESQQNQHSAVVLEPNVGSTNNNNVVFEQKEDSEIGQEPVDRSQKKDDDSDENEMYDNLIEIQLKDNDIVTVERIVAETWFKKDDDMGPASNAWVDYELEPEETTKKENKGELEETKEQDENVFQQACPPDMSSIHSEQEGERLVKESDGMSDTVSELDVNKNEQTLDHKENVSLDEDKIKTDRDNDARTVNEKAETIHEMDCNSEENLHLQKEMVSENQSIKWDGDESITGEYLEVPDVVLQGDNKEILQYKENAQYDATCEKHAVTPQTPCSEKINKTVKQIHEVIAVAIIKETLMENNDKKASESPVIDQDTNTASKVSENRIKEERLQRAHELETERLKKLEQERETARLRKLEEERETERLRKLEEERETKRLRKLEEERETERLRKLEEERETERLWKLEEERETDRLRKLEEERETERLMKLEEERETERLRKLEEERERQIEREKDRMAVDRATLEAREKTFAETRERAAVERATAEFRQRALAEARERLEKACAEARERSLADKAMEGRLRVEKATAEARERAVADKVLYTGIKLNSLPSDLSGSYSGLRYYQAPSQGGEVESPQRCKARLERHQRTADRAAKALAEKNMRDLIAQKEQAERSRLAEGLDAEVKRWSSGKQGNLRALLSTLQYILGADSGWQPVPLTEVITTAAVRKAYRKATLCVHPDKLQQRGATIQQKYICEKVFDLLKEAWNKFNSEER